MDNLYVLSVKINGTGHLPGEAFYFPLFPSNLLTITALEPFESAT
jgi:hypothetical protein